MNIVKVALLSAAALCACAGASDADARGGRHRGHVGIWFGAPFFPYYYPRYYYPPAYYPPAYYPQTVVVPAPASPPVYIEQNAPAPAPAAPSSEGAGAYWYYCRDTQTYYPYVQQCASPWQQVVPQSPPGPQSAAPAEYGGSSADVRSR